MPLGIFPKASRTWKSPSLIRILQWGQYWLNLVKYRQKVHFCLATSWFVKTARYSEHSVETLVILRDGLKMFLKLFKSGSIWEDEGDPATESALTTTFGAVILAAAFSSKLGSFPFFLSSSRTWLLMGLLGSKSLRLTLESMALIWSSDIKDSMLLAKFSLKLKQAIWLARLRKSVQKSSILKSDANGIEEQAQAFISLKSYKWREMT